MYIYLYNIINKSIYILELQHFIDYFTHILFLLIHFVFKDFINFNLNKFADET
jgi:hypothetical protein